jgi:glycosyltransferase involved in cell wall biosynthesis
MTISVCIASFNGAEFIKEQILSILLQLSDDDEIIVSDDCSNDNTINILESFNDPRIKIIRNHINVGHVKNFERALLFAKNEFIFLSDQDDIWLPDKVQSIVKLFIDDPELYFVHHSISLLDSKINFLNSSFNTLPNKEPSYSKFLILQLLTPNVWGCATAFRRDILKIYLPFPRFVYAHDHWLGLVVACRRKRIRLLSNSYLLRRLHGNNLTPNSGGNRLSVKIINRFNLYCLFIISIFRSLLIRF